MTLPNPTAAARPFSGIDAIVLAQSAVAVPFLLAGSVSPSATFFNQAWATAAWGLWLVWMAVRAGRAPAAAPGDARPLWLASAAVALIALCIAAWGGPFGQRLAPLACMLLALATLWAGARLAGPPRAEGWMALLLLALLTAGLLSVIVSLVQVFAPELTDGLAVAHPTTPGRAIGNMRQPNQLSTLLLWACGAAIWLACTGRWATGAVAGLLALLVFALVLTASRTGTVGTVLLACWGLVDRRLPLRLRLLLVASLPFYLLCWSGMSWWAASTHHAFVGDTQLDKTMHGDASSSRWGIWSNTLAMIAAHPWFGVGFGRYNFVWSMTPFPDRPIAFFDHSHNLPLQLAAEFGVPAALLILGLLLAALWRARSALTARDDLTAWSARTALFMLVLVGLHSQLEYPLWYAYFLLPTAALLGWLMGLARHAEAPDDMAAPSATAAPAPPPLLRATLGLAGVLMVAGTLYALGEYVRVVVIFEPDFNRSGLLPLDQRIARGQTSVLFGQHADYAKVTMAEHPGELLAEFERPVYHLFDARLMAAYARAFAESGQLDKARHVAARLREFRNPASDEFFAVCNTDATAFQCQADPRLAAEQLVPAAARR